MNNYSNTTKSRKTTSSRNNLSLPEAPIDRYTKSARQINFQKMSPSDEVQIIEPALLIESSSAGLNTTLLNQSQDNKLSLIKDDLSKFA